ncbi:MAG TPA: hypothetical protein VFR75_11315 [Solirubrobacterales bacterium]|nr:hypothetical protein [Solirubrobacterales bacterium]
MDTPRPYQKIALFAAALAVVFGVAAALGSLVEPAETNEGGMEETMATHSAETDTHGAHASEEAGEQPAGLGVAEDGYAVRFAPTQFERGEAGELRYVVESADGEPVTEFDELHQRRMHLIVVRRDGTEFRHLHPEIDATGTWSVPVRFAEAGVYRAFADFSVGGEQRTLASDLFVTGGEFESRPFPASRPVDSANGYEVHLESGDLVAGEHSELSFAVSRGGQPVDDLAPYLGAKGHLVALREGDLAFLHVHPEESDGAADEIAFDATFPTAGRYRLYLQFKHEGAVHTAEFTVEVSR